MARPRACAPGTWLGTPSHPTPPSPQVQEAAMQCLVKIMSLYYQYMESYMGPALFAVSPGPGLPWHCCSACAVAPHRSHWVQ